MYRFVQHTRGVHTEVIPQEWWPGRPSMVALDLELDSLASHLLISSCSFVNEPLSSVS